jgi:Protein of unknown function (DUF2889)
MAESFTNLSSSSAKSAHELLQQDHDAGWILPAPETRTQVHTRSIVCRSFLRDDGLIDLEGRFIDTRPFPYQSEWRGATPAGEALHHMQLRVTLNSTRHIVALTSAMPNTPYAGCDEVNVNFQRLIGLSIGRGFRKEMLERLGGSEGCTHVLGLLTAMSAAAVQSFTSSFYAPRKPGASKPIRVFNLDAMVDSCYSYREDGPLVRDMRAAESHKKTKQPK